MEIVSPLGNREGRLTDHYKRSGFPKLRFLPYNVTHCMYSHYMILFMLPFRNWSLGTDSNADNLTNAISVSNKFLCLSFVNREF